MEFPTHTSCTCSSQTKQYQVYSHEIAAGSTLTASNIVKSVGSLATTITVYGLATESAWPFVTVPHFETLGSELLELAGSNLLTFNVLVGERNKTAWESYSVAHQGWIQEGLDRQGRGQNASPIVPYIFDRSHHNASSRPDMVPAHPDYGVTWQIAPAPAVPSLVNDNVLADHLFNKTFDVLLEAGHAVLSHAVDVARDSASNLSRPQSFLVSPIFKEDVVNNTVSLDTLGGFLNVMLPWDNFFRNILPENVDGIEVVIRNYCTEDFTFVINGPNVVFQGLGDLHNPSYDNYEVHLQFAYEEEKQDTPAEQAALCYFTYSIYPSHRFQATYFTNKPIIYTVGVALIFVITSAVFIAYDILVERRQNKVMNSAVRSNAIVSSLFPAQVRDRLMDGNNDDPTGKARKNADVLRQAGMAVNGQRLSSAGHQSAGDLSEEMPAGSALFRNQPIADLFPNATVMFGDIAGFTAWSSVREPTQVFVLLESVYNAFDQIARRRKSKSQIRILKMIAWVRFERSPYLTICVPRGQNIVFNSL